MKFQQVKAVVDREIMPCVFQVQCIETGLCFFQGYFHFTGLQHLIRVIRRETKCHTSVYNIFSQSKSQVHCAFFGFFISQGIIIERTCHAGHRRVVTVSVLISHNFLQDDCHLFLVDHVRCSLHIGFTVSEVNRRIDSFDRIGKHTEHFVTVVQIRNHIRIVYSGKRLIMRIFQQGRRTDGNRGLHHIEEGEKVLYQPVGQFRLQEIS